MQMNVGNKTAANERKIMHCWILHKTSTQCHTFAFISSTGLLMLRNTASVSLLNTRVSRLTLGWAKAPHTKCLARSEDRACARAQLPLQTHKAVYYKTKTQDWF